MLLDREATAERALACVFVAHCCWHQRNDPRRHTQAHTHDRRDCNEDAPHSTAQHKGPEAVTALVVEVSEGPHANSLARVEFRCCAWLGWLSAEGAELAAWAE